jgi:tetratricopeptide (TPR) repeat protein
MGLLAVLLLLASPPQSERTTAAEWKELGVVKAASNKLEAAAPAFTRACELDPKDEDSCYFLGRTLYLLDRWDEAREPFEKALRSASKPMLARVHRAMALNYIAVGNIADAERHFEQAILLNPGTERLGEDPRVDYGAFLFRQGRLEEALPVLQKAVAAASRSARAHAELGRALLHAGNLDAAAASLEKSVQLDPRVPSVRLLLGRAYLQLGRSEEGQKQLQLARDGSKEDASSTLK